MEQPHPPLDALTKDPRAAALLKDRAALESLLRSPDAQALLRLLEQSAGGGLQTAADAAARGDAAPLMGLVRSVVESREGAAAAERLRERAPTD